MENYEVQCPACGKPAKVIRFGNGYVSSCCGRVVYNSMVPPQVAQKPDSEVEEKKS